MLSVNMNSSIGDSTIVVVTAAASMLGGLLLFLFSFWRLWWRPHLEQKKPFADIPMVPRSNALTGHLWLLSRDVESPHQILVSESVNAAGRTSIWMARTPVLVLTHWQDARSFLKRETYRIPSPVIRKHIVRMLGPKNILFLNDREWRFHRSALNKSFTPVALEAYRDAMVQVTKTMVSSLEHRIAQQGPFQCEIVPLMKMITLDIFGLAAFSHDFKCCKNLQTSSIAEAFDILSNDLASRLEMNPMVPANYFYCLPTQRNRRNQQARKVLRSFVADALRKRMEPAGASKNSDQKKNKKNDFLTHLINVTKHQGEISPDALADTAITVLFAGHDTTSTTLSYVLHQLSQHPDAQANCLAEIETLSSSSSDGSLTVTDEDLVYCKAVVEETLRLFPPALATTRTTCKPVELPDGYVIAAGTTVNIPIWRVHRSEANFARPNEFLPERWVQRREDASSRRWVEREPSSNDDNNAVTSSSSSNLVPAANPKAFFAFSTGSRNCPGERFARQEAVIVLAGLLKHIRFDTIPLYKLRPQRVGIVQQPDDRLPMVISLRK